jgi:hypothetical protein
MSDWSIGARIAFVLGSLLAAAIGWVGVSHVAGADHGGSAKGAVDIYSCPMSGARSIGQLHPGDAVWVMGVSEHRWAVIRHPLTPDQPAWVPLAMIRTNANPDELPEMGCDTNPNTATTPPPTSSPASTLPGETTTTLPESTTSSSTTTTISSDTTPPTITFRVDNDQKIVYTKTVNQCSDTLIFSVRIADPSLPLTLNGFDVTWPGGDGSVVAQQLIGTNKWQVVFSGQAISAPQVPLTITATATDGAGNQGTGTLLLTLATPPATGCK